jgi:hypothetical protein
MLTLMYIYLNITSIRVGGRDSAITRSSMTATRTGLRMVAVLKRGLYQTISTLSALALRVSVSSSISQ